MTTPAEWLNLDEGATQALVTAIANELRSRHDAHNLATYSDADLLTLLNDLQDRPGAFMPELPAALAGALAASQAEGSDEISIQISQLEAPTQTDYDDSATTAAPPAPAPQPEPKVSPLERLIALANTPLSESPIVDTGLVRAIEPLGDGEGDAFVSSYRLQINDPTDTGGSFYLRFDDARTGDLSTDIDAASLDAAIEGLDDVISAEVSGEAGEWDITLLASENHPLGLADLLLTGDGGLYLLNQDERATEALVTAIANELRSRHDAYDLATYSDAALLTLLNDLQDRPGAFTPELPAALDSALAAIQAEDSDETQLEPPPATDPEVTQMQRLIALANTPLSASETPEDRLTELANTPVSLSEDSHFTDTGAVRDIDPVGDSDSFLSRYWFQLNDPTETGGTFFLRFDDARTSDLPASITAASLDAAIEGLDGITSAEVSGTAGDWNITILASENHVLGLADLSLTDEGGLYLLS